MPSMISFTLASSPRLAASINTLLSNLSSSLCSLAEAPPSARDVRWGRFYFTGPSQWIRFPSLAPVYVISVNSFSSKVVNIPRLPPASDTYHLSLITYHLSLHTPYDPVVICYTIIVGQHKTSFCTLYTFIVQLSIIKLIILKKQIYNL